MGIDLAAWGPRGSDRLRVCFYPGRARTQFGAGTGNLDRGELIFLEAEGLTDFQHYLKIAPDIATTAARVSLNQTMRRKGLKMAQDAMLAQVAFPRGYLSGLAGNGEPRFRIFHPATNDRLYTGLRGRFEPTSLSRFATNRPQFVGGRHRRGQSIYVRVDPGATRELKNSFFIKLRNGNIGLGVRLNGKTLTNTTGAKLITSGPLKGVALLYGPSVDQVFRTVAVDISQPLLDELALEFMRQFAFRSRAN